MIWLAPKATGIEISSIPKGNVDLLQLLGLYHQSWLQYQVEHCTLLKSS